MYLTPTSPSYKQTEKFALFFYFCIHFRFYGFFLFFFFRNSILSAPCKNNKNYQYHRKYLTYVIISHKNFFILQNTHPILLHLF